MKSIIQRTFVFLLILLFVTIGYYFYPEDDIATNCVINKIIVEKSRRKMSVYQDDVLLKTYKISLGFNPVGHKQEEGDGRTPEGNYIIVDKNPNSSCYKNIGISYPNDSDKMLAESRAAKPGGDIKIHGILNGKNYWGKFHRWFDWTSGCIAVTNQEMDEIYDHTLIGAKILIKP